MISSTHDQLDTAASDLALLRRFTEAGCHEAFELLVHRHIGWVSALVRRKIRDDHQAEDITQAVFIILARKGHCIREGTVLSAWLFRVARFAIRDAVKQEQRQKLRWNRVAELHAASNGGQTSANGNSRSSVDLDDALACLSETDRQAILLRFYEDLSMAEIGVNLGIGEVAAKKRVSRALQRLRKILERNGRTIATMTLLAAMLREASNSQAAINPATVRQIAQAARGQASAPSVHVAQMTLKSIASAQSHVWSAMAAGTLAVVVVVGILSPAMGQAVVALLQNAGKSISNAVYSFGDGSLIQTMLSPSIQSDKKQQVPVAKMWLGNGNSSIRPMLPHGNAGAPLPTRTVSGSTDPVAVVQDLSGNYWYRRVDPQATRAIAEIEALEQFDRSFAGAAAGQLQLSDLPLDYFQTSDFMAVVDGNDWKEIKGPGSDGFVKLPYAGLNGGSEGLGSEPTIGAVPEPISITSLAILGAAMCMRRRRPSCPLK